MRALRRVLFYDCVFFRLLRTFQDILISIFYIILIVLRFLARSFSSTLISISISLYHSLCMFKLICHRHRATSNNSCAKQFSARAHTNFICKNNDKNPFLLTLWLRQCFEMDSTPEVPNREVEKKISSQPQARSFSFPQFLNLVSIYFYPYFFLVSFHLFHIEK